MKKFEHLHIPGHWQQYWSRYPEGYTILEAIINWASQVDKMVDNQNNLNKEVTRFRGELDDFVSQFGDNLQTEVVKTLDKWQQDGFLDIVIDQALNTKIDRLEENMNDLVINVKRPPTSLSPLKMDGEDETENLQNILDYAGEVGGATVHIPTGIVMATTLYVPNNVTLRGSGRGTIIKLPDNSPLVYDKVPTGIYPKKRVDFFAVKDLTYDGNALNNINLADISGNMYATDFWAQGICNSYNDSNTIEDGTSQPRSAKDFIIDNVTVKNVIRNSILIGGGSGDQGTVRNATLENAYLDHFIYESNTNTRVLYENIVCSGVWRDMAIVLESGVITNLEVKGIEHPSPHYDLGNVLQSRSQRPNNEDTPVVTNAKINVPFSEVSAIVSTGTSSKGMAIENMFITQTDKVSVSRYGYPTDIVGVGTGGNYTIKNVVLNNINQIGLLALRQGAHNVFVDNVTINYTNSPAGDSDRLVGITNSGDANSPITNIKITNVTTNGDKSPPLLNLRRVGGNRVTIKNMVFGSINMVGSGRGVITNIDSNSNIMTIDGIFINNSVLKNYDTSSLDSLINMNTYISDSLVNSNFTNLPDKESELGVVAEDNSITYDTPMSHFTNLITLSRTQNNDGNFPDEGTITTYKLVSWTYSYQLFKTRTSDKLYIRHPTSLDGGWSEFKEV